MDASIPSVLLLVLVLIIAAAGIFLGMQASKKRTQAFEQIALELGMTFNQDDDPELLANLQSFSLFNRGRGRRQFNLLKALRQQAEVALFDYRYTTGAGKSQHTHIQTIFYARLEENLFPAAFLLRPENVFDKLGGLLKVKDINFPEQPVFSKLYALKGEDETGIRSIFTGSVLSFFEQNPGLSIEARESHLLLYREGKRVRPEDLRAFLELGQNVIAQFSRPCREF